MISILKRAAKRQQFNPGFLGIFLNPFFLSRRALWKGISANAAAIRGHVLDVGCGQKPYEKLFATTKYVGLEIDTPHSRARGIADYYYDGTTFPFENSTFDAVVCNQVLEHVFQPEQFLAEVHRVLKPGGKLLLTVPFVWDEHEQPHDFARYTSFALHYLLQNADFALISHQRTLANFSIIAQMVNAYLFKVVRTPSPLVNAAGVALLGAPVSALGLLLGWILPSNNDLYLDSIVLAEKRS
jgi:SAM-dependent methyltransferase